MERPILFSTAMVQAILDGKKTMTRRVVAPWQQPFKVEENADIIGNYAVIAQRHPRWGFCFFGDTPEECMGQLHSMSPYGNPSDLLFVRESWRPWLTDIWPNGFERLIKYEADDAVLRVPENQSAWFDKIEKNGYGKRPSIHLPKWATRIWLEVTGVRVERLQSIGEEDAMKEGISAPKFFDPQEEAIEPSARFKELWDSINGKPRKDGVDISWAADPWVWVVSFKRIEK